MRTQLLLVLTIALLAGFLPGASFASEDTTTLTTIASEWQGKMVLCYWEDDIGLAVGIPLITYSRNSEEVASLNFLSDFDRHWDITASAKLTPVNKWIKEKLGTGGNISVPVLDVVITKFVDLEVFAGGGYDSQEDKAEYVVGLNILSAKF